MSNFRAETLKWRREEMTADDYTNVEKVLSDSALLEIASMCLAIEEGCCQQNSFSKRVREIVDTPGFHIEAAIYLIYHKSPTFDQAKKLFRKLQKENSFQAVTPPGLSISNLELF